MALVYCDSFDHYTTITHKGWIPNYSQGFAIQSGQGRGGSACARFTGPNATSRNIARPLPAALTTFIVGFAYRASGFETGDIARFHDGSTQHLTLRFDASKRLQLTRAGTVLATGSTIFNANVYYFIELKATISDTGSYEVRVNGTTEFSGSGDTRNAGNPSINQVLLVGTPNNNGPTWDFDDLYVCDTTGSVNNDFLGDIRVECLFPNGNGASSQWVGSDGNSVDNYLLVDEAAPNDDTDYVTSATVGDKDTYAYSNLTPGSGSVYAVQIAAWARKTDVAERKIATIARTTSEQDSADRTLATTYTYYLDVRNTRPGGGAWSISDVNGAEFGVKVTA